MTTTRYYHPINDTFCDNLDQYQDVLVPTNGCFEVYECYDAGLTGGLYSDSSCQQSVEGDAWLIEGCWMNSPYLGNNVSYGIEVLDCAACVNTNSLLTLVLS